MRFGIAEHKVISDRVGFSVGLVGVILFMVAFETMEIVWTWQLIGSLVNLIIASSLIDVGLQLTMIRAGEVSKLFALIFLVPPMAAAVSWIMLDEIMSPLAWVGMVIAGLGVFMATTKKQAAA